MVNERRNFHFMTLASKQFVILASGTGMLFSSITKACLNGRLKARVIGLVSDRKKAPVLKKAQDLNIPIKIFHFGNDSSFEKWDEDLCTYLKNQKPDFILLAGFLRRIGEKVLLNFENQILNIHPALLPRHGGKGMYGIHVHRSVLQSGDKETGISIHLVSKQYDAGPVLAQKKIPVSPDETAESLQEKVKKFEPEFFISFLEKLIKNEIHLSVANSKD